MNYVSCRDTWLNIFETEMPDSTLKSVERKSQYMSFNPENIY